MNYKKINLIKEEIKDECLNGGKVGAWFYSVHLLGVEKFAKFLLSKLPKASKEVVMLGVWLHDIQWIRGLKGDHAKVGVKEAGKFLKNRGYNKEVIKEVQSIILTHSCDKNMPHTLEGKILASADAMSHYYNDFYFQIAVTGQRNLDEYKKWVLEKLDKNYNKKIFFKFAKDKIKTRHNLFKKVFTLK